MKGIIEMNTKLIAMHKVIVSQCVLLSIVALGLSAAADDTGVLTEPVYPNAVAIHLAGCEEESGKHFLVAGTNATATIFIRDYHPEWTYWQKFAEEGGTGVGGRFRHKITGFYIKGIPAAKIDVSTMFVNDEDGRVEIPTYSLGEKISPAWKDIWALTEDDCEYFVSMSGPKCRQIEGFEEYANDTCYEVEFKLPKGSGAHGHFFWTAHVLFDDEQETWSYTKTGEIVYAEPIKISAQQIPGSATSWRDIRDYLLLTNDLGRVFFAKDEKDYNDKQNNRGIPNWFKYWADDGAVPQLANSEYRAVPTYDSLFTHGGEYCFEFGGIHGSDWGRYYSDSEKIELYERAGDGHYYAQKEGTSYKLLGRNISVTHEGKKYEFVDDTVFGIYTVENVLAHESMHKKLSDEYWNELWPHLQGVTDLGDRNLRRTEFDSDMVIVGEGTCAVSFLSLGCRIHYEILACDTLSDIMEQIYKTDKDKLDKYQLGVPGSSAFKGHEYSTYGDNEFLAMLAGWNANNNTSVQETKDWAFPGHQSYLPWPFRHRNDKIVSDAHQVQMACNPIILKMTEREHSEEGSICCTSLEHSLLTSQGGQQYSGIRYDFAFDVMGTNRLEIIGYLSDVHSNIVARTKVRSEFLPGQSNCTLFFDGQDIYASEKDGPYMLLGLVFKRYDGLDSYFTAAVSDLSLPNIECSRENFVRADATVIEKSITEDVEEDGITFGIDVAVEVAATYKMTVTVMTTNGAAIGQYLQSVNCSLGTNRFEILVPVDDICYVAENGPYVISEIEINRELFDIDDVKNVYVTKMADFASYYGFEGEEPTGTETIGDYTWSYSIVDNQAVVEKIIDYGFGSYKTCAVDPMPAGDISLPSTLGGKPVVGIGESAFDDCQGMTSIQIPSSVTNIGAWVFSGCSELTNLLFAGNAPFVGDYAFSGVDWSCTVTVYEDSLGWDDDGDGYWNDLEIVWRERGCDPIPEMVTITFNPNGGSCDVSALSVESGKTLANLPTASRAGYVFKGWFTKATGGEQVTAKTAFSGVKTVYAQWEQVKYQPEIEGDCDDVSQGGAAVGQIVRMYMFDEKTGGYTNWVCTGWIGTGDVPATGTSNEVSFVVKDGGTIKWLYQTNYWVAVDANVSFASGNDSAVRSDAFETNACTGANASTCVGGRVVVRNAAGVAITNELWAAAGTNLIAEATANVGWVFAGWLEADGGRGATALPDGGHAGRVTLPVTHPWMLDAVFTQKVFAVAFDLGEHGTRKGGGALTQNVSYGAAAVAPNVTVAKDYAFDEWSAAFDCVTSNMTVRALYHSLMSHVGVSFVDGCSGMGKVTGGDKGMKAGAKVTLKATANAAKKATGKTAAQIATVFAGWYRDATGTTPADDGWLNPSYSFTMPAEDVTLYAKFIAQTDDVAAVEMALPGEMTNGVSVVNAAVDVSGCSSLPTVKVAGLPTGLKFTTKLVTVKVTTGSGKDKVTTIVTNALPNTIYGTPTKSGVYTIVATVTTAGKKTASCSQTVVVRKPGENVVKAEAVLIDAIGTIASTEAVPGKVTGMGVYQAGKKVTLKATANKGYVFNGWYEADEGSSAIDCNRLQSTAASYAFAMPVNDVALTAAFITSACDKSNIVATVNGMAFGEPVAGTRDACPYLATNVWTGVYLEWPVAASALSETTVKVAGLPSGLKFTAKPVTTKTTSGSGKTKVTMVVTNIAANTIYGAPSAASKTKKAKDGTVTVTPSQVKVTVTTAGKNSQTYQIDTTVDPLPSWAVGSFTGPSYGSDETNGLATVTIVSSGKISAKQPVDGKTASFVASYFDGYADTFDFGPTFYATMTAKVGKEVVTNEMAVCGEEMTVGGGTPTLPDMVVTNGYVAADRFDAWQYNWKSEPWKTLGKSFDKKLFTYVILSDGTIVDEDDGGEELAALPGEVTGAGGVRALPVDGTNVTGKVTLKFAASGAVTASGEFASLDADGSPVYKNKKLVTLKATGSSTLVPASASTCVFVYLAPKGLEPHARCVEVQ